MAALSASSTRATAFVCMFGKPEIGQRGGATFSKVTKRLLAANSARSAYGDFDIFEIKWRPGTERWWQVRVDNVSGTFTQRIADRTKGQK
jgi:hypothetical protein